MVALINAKEFHEVHVKNKTLAFISFSGSSWTCSIYTYLYLKSILKRFCYIFWADQNRHKFNRYTSTTNKHLQFWQVSLLIKGFKNRTLIQNETKNIWKVNSYFCIVIIPKLYLMYITMKISVYWLESFGLCIMLFPYTLHTVI